MSALRPNQREKAASSKAGSGSLLPNGLIDPTKAGKYPVILSDTLLGKTQKDVFTAVRYNHKPTLSSESAPGTARLKPDTPGSKKNYELFFQDGGGKYAYEGSRTMDDNQYVLYFDQARKAFILDRVDSTFNLNLTRTPATTNPETLRQKYPQLDASISVDTRRNEDAVEGLPSKPAIRKTEEPATKANNTTAAKNRKQADKKKEVKVVELALPTHKPAKPPPKKKRADSDEEDEEEDDDDDFGLTIEYPGSEPNPKRADFSPAFPAPVPMRRFSEFLRDSEADDADGEVDDDFEDDRGLEGFKLPSPMNVHEQKQAHAVPDAMDVDSEADFEDALEDDLEAELEKELEQANSGDAEESEVSEED